jgi:hypothetical protein
MACEAMFATPSPTTSCRGPAVAARTPAWPRPLETTAAHRASIVRPRPSYCSTSNRPGPVRLPRDADLASCVVRAPAPAPDLSPRLPPLARISADHCYLRSSPHGPRIELGVFLINGLGPVHMDMPRQQKSDWFWHLDLG